MKKTGFLVSFILEGTLTAFLISQNFSFIFGAFERKGNNFWEFTFVSKAH